MFSAVLVTIAILLMIFGGEDAQRFAIFLSVMAVLIRLGEIVAILQAN